MRLAQMMEKGTFLLACEPAGRILASVYVEVRETRAYFGMLAVDPAAQGNGLGRVMVMAAEDYCRARNCKAMDITVLSLRPELPGFYSCLGYAITGTEEFHPSRPLRAGVECHGIVMSKAL
jgi:GNAT superfamily N-acetyltransferase